MKNGFCLLETILAVAILLIIITVLYPAYYGWQTIIYRFEIDASANAIASDIRWLQQASLNKGKTHNYRMVFCGMPNGYYIQDRAVMVKDVQTDDKMPNTRLERYPQCISFTVNGTPLYSGTIVIRHRKNPSLYREITVLPATGRVMIK